MIFAEPQGEMRIPFEIMKLQRELEELKWWQFIKKHKLNNQIFEMKVIGARIGFELAINDLEEMGMIKRIKSPSKGE